MNRTGVVVVTYNSGDVIERCLDSCAHLLVVVVDNASKDNTVDLVRRRSNVKLIANSGNRGFAGAANQGVEALDTRNGPAAESGRGARELRGSAG